MMKLAVFESGEVEKWVEIAITDDEKVEKERESIHLYLTGGDEAFQTPFPNTIITITDDDGEILPTVHHVSCLFLYKTTGLFVLSLRQYTWTNIKANVSVYEHAK